MAESIRPVGRDALEGIAIGIMAGFVFGLAEIAGAAVTGISSFAPVRLAASVLLGSRALAAASPPLALVAGLAVHFVLAGLFGMLFGVFRTQLEPVWQRSWARSIVTGLLFGAIVWLVDFQLVARLVYPWFLDADQGLQALLHALFFGLPLGLLQRVSDDRTDRFAPTAI